MRISLDDDVIEAVQAGLRPGQSLEQELERRLKAAGHVRAGQPLIVLDTVEMDAIAERIGTGLPIRTKVDLNRAIDAVAQVTMGSERLVFTPGMLQQITERARKIGETPERFIGRVASKLITDVFLVEPGPEGVFYTPGFDPTDEVEEEPPYDQGKDLNDPRGE